MNKKVANSSHKETVTFFHDHSTSVLPRTLCQGKGLLMPLGALLAVVDLDSSPAVDMGVSLFKGARGVDVEELC